jgi:hypothetical protein
MVRIAITLLLMSMNLCAQQAQRFTFHDQPFLLKLLAGGNAAGNTAPGVIQATNASNFSSLKNVVTLPSTTGTNHMLIVFFCGFGGLFTPVTTTDNGGFTTTWQSGLTTNYTANTWFGFNWTTNTSATISQLTNSASGGSLFTSVAMEITNANLVSPVVSYFVRGYPFNTNNIQTEPVTVSGNDLIIGSATSANVSLSGNAAGTLGTWNIPKGATNFAASETISCVNTQVVATTTSVTHFWTLSSLAEAACYYVIIKP